ncbi:MAG: hypothetical protein BJ554DRAFT_6285 [Olpidium bornovanus]|uniref:Uncharacterized protein n=1 Tax=Olpidium bornovanus TaxID=278681 RepID=A0A8H7ZY67_9FUNG|nr:MAG: hypothetical protein BJ554DRAFT_6285 [Olpidium bornovanus]
MSLLDVTASAPAERTPGVAFVDTGPAALPRSSDEFNLAKAAAALESAPRSGAAAAAAAAADVADVTGRYFSAGLPGPVVPPKLLENIRAIRKKTPDHQQQQQQQQQLQGGDGDAPENHGKDATRLPRSGRRPPVDAEAQQKSMDSAQPLLLSAKPPARAKVNAGIAAPAAAHTPRDPTWLRRTMGAPEKLKNLSKELDILESALEAAQVNLGPDQNDAPARSAGGSVKTASKWNELKVNLKRATKVNATERVKEMANAAAAAAALRQALATGSERVLPEEVKVIARAASQAAALRKKVLKDTVPEYSFAKSPQQQLVNFWLTCFPRNPRAYGKEAPAFLRKILWRPSGRTLSDNERSAVDQIVSASRAASPASARTSASDTAGSPRPVLPGIQKKSGGLVLVDDLVSPISTAPPETAAAPAAPLPVQLSVQKLPAQQHPSQQPPDQPLPAAAGGTGPASAASKSDSEKADAIVRDAMEKLRMLRDMKSDTSLGKEDNNLAGKVIPVREAFKMSPPTRRETTEKPDTEGDTIKGIPMQVDAVTLSAGVGPHQRLAEQMTTAARARQDAIRDRKIMLQALRDGQRVSQNGSLPEARTNAKAADASRDYPSSSAAAAVACGAGGRPAEKADFKFAPDRPAAAAVEGTSAKLGRALSRSVGNLAAPSSSSSSSISRKKGPRGSSTQLSKSGCISSSNLISKSGALRGSSSTLAKSGAFGSSAAVAKSRTSVTDLRSGASRSASNLPSAAAPRARPKRPRAANASGSGATGTSRSSVAPSAGEQERKAVEEGDDEAEEDANPEAASLGMHNRTWPSDDPDRRSADGETEKKPTVSRKVNLRQTAERLQDPS